MSGLKSSAAFVTWDTSLCKTDSVIPSQAVCVALVHIDLILCNVIHEFSTLGPTLLLQQKANEGVMNTVCKHSEGESCKCWEMSSRNVAGLLLHVHPIMQQARKGRSTKYWCPGKSLLQRTQTENREDSKWLLDWIPHVSCSDYNKSICEISQFGLLHWKASETWRNQLSCF